MPEPRIVVRRVYDPPSGGEEGCLRILAERLWPRGVRKAELKLDMWPKELAPSTELRRWFRHDPAKWEEFRARYFAELDSKRELVEELCRAIAERGCAVLLYSARDREHNSAVALRDYLLERCGW